MSNSISLLFYKISADIAIMFFRKFIYNTILLIVYCSLGSIAEPTKQLICIYLYTVIVNFLIALTFFAIMQFFCNYNK